MEITPTQSTAAVQAAKPAAQEASSDTAIAGDFETFLRLLTTQMRNQDPLKPMESTEFVAQLASFSSVEQQIRTNDGLDRIFELLSGGTADGLAAWIGKEIRAPGKAEFNGDPVDVEVTPVDNAGRSVLVVKNDFGQVVARQTVAPGESRAIWDGSTDLGAQAPYGRYSFELQGFEGTTAVGATPGRIFSSVTEVRFEDGLPMLVVEDGTQIPLAEVTALR